MDFKKFYFSPEARVNRKQWWLWLVLPFTVISILLGFWLTALCLGIRTHGGSSEVISCKGSPSLAANTWPGSAPRCPPKGFYSGTFGFPLLSSAGVVALGLPPLSTVPPVA